jgi:two-component system, NtrC family, C4-dicarboxylate transport sensor histidine kinase DctB
MFLVIALPTIIISTYTHTKYKDDEIKKMIKNKTNIINGLSVGLEKLVWENYDNILKDIVKNILKDKDIRKIKIYDNIKDSIIVEKNITYKCDNKENIYKLKKILYIKNNIYKNENIGYIKINFSDCQIQKELKDKKFNFYTIILIQILLSIIILLLLIKYKLLSPIIKLLENLQKMGQKKLSKPFIWEQKDEIGELGREIEKTRVALKNLFEQEEKIKKEIQNLDQKLYQQSKLASLGELIVIITHQWRQPLSTISGIVGNISINVESYDGKYIHNSMQKIEDNLQMLSNTMSNFISFYDEKNDSQNFNVKNTIQSCIDILSPHRHFNYELSINCKEDIVIYGEKNLFQQVILTILSNAIEQFKIKFKSSLSNLRNINKKDIAMLVEELKIKENENKPKISINILKYKKYISKIEIIDNAGGIDQNIIKDIFKAHTTTKKENKNNGLGLYIAKKIIDQRKESMKDANIYAQNIQDGAKFTIIY